MRPLMPALAAVVATILLGGCGGPRDAAFTDVRATVTARTGSQVHWNQGTDEDRAAEQAVAALLAKPLTPESAVQVALLTSPRLQALYEDLGVAQADLVKAGMLRNPVFEGQVNFFAAGPAIELSLIQDFIDLLYLPTRKRIASAALDGIKSRVAGTVIGFAGDVRRAAYQVQASEQLREMRQMILTGAEAADDLSTRIHAAGNNTVLAHDRDRAMYEQAKLDLAEAEAEVLDAHERLTVMLGVWGTATGWTMAPRLAQLPGTEAPLDDLEKRAITCSLDLLAAQQDIILATRQYGLVSPYVPAVTLGADLERDAGGAWGLGPKGTVEIPVFNHGQGISMEAQSRLQRAWSLYAATALEVRSGVRMARNRVVAARSRAEYLRAVMIPLRQRIVGELQLHYNAMLIGAFELLQGKADEIGAGRDYLMALRDYWIARSELDQILSGRLARFDSMAPGAMSGAAPTVSEGH
ncbi:MAG: TolC family protein [Planctomycetes bacterium]|nr:TolC family protein [Planctomycetota bacterium]